MLHLGAFLLYLLLSGALSSLWLALVWLADRYEREPIHILALAVFWGAAPAVVVSCILQATVSAPVSALAGGDVAHVVGAVFVAPVTEEALKAGALLLVVLLFRKEFDGVLDGMVYGAAVGIGFSFVEDLLYFSGALLEDGAAFGAVVFALRNLAFALNHSLFTALTGIGVGLARVSPRGSAGRWLWPPAGLACAVAAHALHNTLALLDLPGVLLAFLIHGAAGIALLALIPLLWSVERRWVLREVGEEISEGHVPQEVLAALPFSGQRDHALLPGQVRSLRGALIRLAFQRRQAEEWSPEAARSLEPLRCAIRATCTPRGTVAHPGGPNAP